jgi:hypothetical protein
MMPQHASPAVEHPGGWYTCRYFGERIDVAVGCLRPGREHVRSQAEQGCAFWEREPCACVPMLDAASRRPRTPKR